MSSDEVKKVMAFNKPKTNIINKKERLYNSRKIRSQINDPAFVNPPKGKNTAKKLIESQIVPNKLSIPEFLEAREFEIKALEHAMIKSKTAGSSRVFQNLPRSMRRRTASHNVKRIPKRMRRKALKEMGVKSGDVNGTKGITPSGRPIKKKQSRGRLRWKLHRKMKLLKWANKWKLEGHLFSGEWVSAKNMKIGDRLNELRKEINELKAQRDLNKNEMDVDSNSLVSLERSTATKHTFALKNQTGAYDNTSVNELSKIHKVSSIRYATRQRRFKWLPTHVWHAKRAKMIKRWGWSIPYEPTQKCFRNTSRSGRFNGCVAQDTSFMGTIVINAAKQDELLPFVAAFTQNKACLKKYVFGKKIWSGYVFNTEDMINPLGCATLFWSIKDVRAQLIIRSHPSIYSKVYLFCLEHFQNNENVTIHDCKYSIGSIDITGPKAITALQSILHKRNNDSQLQFDSFMKLFKLNDIDVIPDGVHLAFDIADPRYWTAPVLPTKPKLDKNEDVLDTIISLKQCTLELSGLFDMHERNNSYCNQLSNKLLACRRSLHPGEAIPLETTDPSIPVVLYKLNSTWTLMLPWFWVLPTWYQLMHVPHIQLSGLKQSEQLNFERGLLGWSDLVFTFDGFVQCELEKDVAKERWQRRPKSKRVEYAKIHLSKTELGETLNPWGLDWRGLQVLRLASRRVEHFGTINYLKEIKRDDKLNIIPSQKSDISTVVKAIQSAESQLKELKKHDLLVKYMPIQLANSTTSPMSKETIGSLCFNIKTLPPLNVTPIKFHCVSVGNVQPNARIYMLPEDQKHKLNVVQSEDVLSILGKCEKPKLEFDVPHVDHLVGLVSSSMFNLVEGRSTGIAFVDFDAIINKAHGEMLARNNASTAAVLISWQRMQPV